MVVQCSLSFGVQPSTAPAWASCIGAQTVERRRIHLARAGSGGAPGPSLVTERAAGRAVGPDASASPAQDSQFIQRSQLLRPILVGGSNAIVLLVDNDVNATYEEPTMKTDTKACTCGTCAGKTCTCGCQAVQSERRAGCRCGDACTCGASCAC